MMYTLRRALREVNYQNMVRNYQIDKVTNIPITGMWWVKFAFFGHFMIACVICYTSAKN